MKTASKTRSRNSFSDEHRKYMMNTADGIRSRKRNPNLTFSEVCNRLNRRFGTNFSIYQVSAFLGNQGMHQG